MSVSGDTENEFDSLLEKIGKKVGGIATSLSKHASLGLVGAEGRRRYKEVPDRKKRRNIHHGNRLPVTKKPETQDLTKGDDNETTKFYHGNLVHMGDPMEEIFGPQDDKVRRGKRP